MNLFRTPQRGTDLRHVETLLTADERTDAINECRRLKAIEKLGPKWLLASDYNGHYRPELMPSKVPQ